MHLNKKKLQEKILFSKEGGRARSIKNIFIRPSFNPNGSSVLSMSSLCKSYSCDHTKE